MFYKCWPQLPSSFLGLAGIHPRLQAPLFMKYYLQIWASLHQPHIVDSSGVVYKNNPAFPCPVWLHGMLLLCASFASLISSPSFALYLPVRQVRTHIACFPPLLEFMISLKGATVKVMRKMDAKPWFSAFLCMVQLNQWYLMSS